MSKPVFIIAEAGVNHNGDVRLARALVDAAVEAGANAVKFQIFRAEALVNRTAEQAAYQTRNTGRTESQFEMLKGLELTESEFTELSQHCAEVGIEFLASPFDLESIGFLETLGMTLYKVPSGEITNLPYLRRIAGLGKRVILSTGMATMEEVRSAVDVLTADALNNEDIVLLHCTTEYPVPMQDVNLRAMLLLKGEFPESGIGYSDHTEGVEVAVAAVALGANVLEKHLTLDKSMDGPDHKASRDLEEFRQMVECVRNIESALGTGSKVPVEVERENMAVVRKSIVASCLIKAGDFFSEENLTVKRPGTGVSPMLWDEVVGAVAKCDFQEDDLIEI